MESGTHMAPPTTVPASRNPAAPAQPAPHLFARVLREQLLQLSHDGAPDIHLLGRVVDARDGLPAAAGRVQMRAAGGDGGSGRKYDVHRRAACSASIAGHPPAAHRARQPMHTALTIWRLQMQPLRPLTCGACAPDCRCRPAAACTRGRGSRGGPAPMEQQWISHDDGGARLERWWVVPSPGCWSANVGFVRSSRHARASPSQLKFIHEPTPRTGRC